MLPKIRRLAERPVGRDRPLSDLRMALAHSSKGNGSCVILEGPPGIGKTRLLKWLAVEASRQDFAVASGQTAELDRVTPLATLLRVPRTRPLLILLDDAQWADEPTALALRVLIPSLAETPVLWVLARRPGPVRGTAPSTQEAIDWLIGAGAQRIQLDPLDDQAVEMLCAHTLGAAPDSCVLTLAARCGGNPLLVGEMLTTLREAGQLKIVAGRATVMDARLPTQFLSTVHQRLCDLSDRVRRLLEAGAVLGRPFTLHEAAGLLGCTAVDLVPAASDAVTCGVLTDRDNELAFRHELIREAIYDALSGAVRSALHREAANVLQAEGRPVVEAAEHLTRCTHPGTEQAKDLLGAAADEVAPTAPGSAADLTLRRLELFGAADPDRPWVVADAVRLLAAAGRVEQATELGEQAMRAGLDAESEARLVIGLCEALKHAGRNRVVVCYADRALAREGVPEAARAQLLAIRAHGLLDGMDLSAADRAGAEAYEVGTRTGQHAAVVFGVVARSVAARAAGALDEAVARAREAVRIADHTGGAASQRHPRLWLGRALAATDRFTEADEVYDLGQRETEQLGTAWSIPLWHYYRAELRMAAGRLADAQAEAQAGLRSCEQFAARALAVPLLGLLSQVALLREELVAAREHLGCAERLLSEGIGAGPEDLSWRVALLADAADQPAAAVQALSEIYDNLPGRLQLLTQDPLAGTQLVRIAMRAGATAQAKAAAEATRLMARRNPAVPSLAATATHAEGLLRGDLTSLRNAVQAFESSPRVLARAAALEDTARAERDAGQRSAAMELLRTALALYQASDARRDATRVGRRMHRLGARRSSVTSDSVSSPWDTLTESELRVVRLVARGLTNREAAAELFLSPHTVDSHLRHSFAKLGVNSRVELTRQVLRHDRPGD